MARPKSPRRMCCKPCCTCFKPQGLDGDKHGEVDLLADEFEALKLHDVDGLNQEAAAKEMKISQSTFARILASVHKKVAEAIVGGKEIRIKGI